jgi:hypothetical protein
MRSRTVSVFALVAAAALHASLAAAQLRVGGGGVEVQGPNNTAVAQADASAPVRDMRRPGGQTLRCWQSGRLLYEGSGFRGGLERNPNAIGVPRRAEGDPVVVLDLKHAVCILSES